MAHTFLTPSKIISGSNALNDAQATIASCGTKALIVTDETMIKLGNAQKVIDILSANDQKFVVFAGVTGEPNDIMIADGVKAYQENECDFLIAIGGGSPIDSMKAIAMMNQSKEPIASYMGKNIEMDLPKMIAIPTTAGTGSEATMFTIITDTASEVKMLLKGACLIPDVAIIDPLFSMSAPKSVTSSTGIDALCHAVEAYTSRKAQPLSDTFALSAIKRIFNNLLIAYNEPSNEEARIQMSLAALEAGIAFNNSSVTIVHGMSRPIGALFHVPHGLSNAMLLEGCMKYVVDGAYDRFADIARYTGVSTSTSDKKAANDFINYLVDFLAKMNVPTMSEYGIDKETFDGCIDKMANDAYASGSPSNTRKEIKVSDMVRLYKEIYK
ncbi:iron-containing alcohol dehydrogenase [uncultured Traorella sp.]|uniref:iron-containing alcohol dehydrogenase n=1 Tax=uncultured Traorella sp. TaxID=1929048 RepID=UPI0025E5102A|nr:iron-containing alcohol dehydrogenase [uncultured Traorella sp.]